MKFKRRLNSKGFSHVELLLLVVTLVTIVGVGVMVYKHDDIVNAGSVSLPKPPYIVKMHTSVVACSGACSETNSKFAVTGQKFTIEWKVVAATTVTVPPKTIAAIKSRLDPCTLPGINNCVVFLSTDWVVGTSSQELPTNVYSDSYSGSGGQITWLLTAVYVVPCGVKDPNMFGAWGQFDNNGYTAPMNGKLIYSDVDGSIWGNWTTIPLNSGACPTPKSNNVVPLKSDYIKTSRSFPGGNVAD